MIFWFLVKGTKTDLNPGIIERVYYTSLSNEFGLILHEHTDQSSISVKYQANPAHSQTFKIRSDCQNEEDPWSSPVSEGQELLVDCVGEGEAARHDPNKSQPNSSL